MPLADSDQDQRRFRRLFVGSKNRAPLTGRTWDVELHTASKAGPIMAFLFTTKKPFARNSVAAYLFYDRFDRCLPCLGAAG